MANKQINELKMHYDDLVKHVSQLNRKLFPNHDWTDSRLIVTLAISGIQLMIWVASELIMLLLAVANIAHGSLAGAFLMVLGLLTAVMHMTPNVIAIYRNHPQSMAIAALNICLGWVCVGWVASLVWSLTTPKTTNS